MPTIEKNVAKNFHKSSKSGHTDRSHSRFNPQLRKTIEHDTRMLLNITKHIHSEKLILLELYSIKIAQIMRSADSQSKKLQNP